MRKILLGALFLSGVANAATTWEYAELTVISTSTPQMYFWISPDKDGMGASATGKTRDELGAKANCGSLKIVNNSDFFNCVGKRGWELVSTNMEQTPPTKMTTYLFKRSK